MAANLADALPQTGGGWACNCEECNPVTDTTVNNVSANPFYKLKKIKKKLKGIGL